MFEIFLCVIILNFICFWCKENHELGIEKRTKFGRFDIQIGIEKPKHRNFDFTLSIDPLWYWTFQLSLWSIYCGCGWSKDTESYPDCSHDGATCFHCGCPNRCGEKIATEKKE